MIIPKQHLCYLNESKDSCGFNNFAGITGLAVITEYRSGNNED